MLSACFATSIAPLYLLSAVGFGVHVYWMFHAYELTLWQAIQVIIGLKRIVLGKTERIAAAIFGIMCGLVLVLAYFACDGEIVGALTL